MKNTILIVDDEELNLKVLSGILGSNYDVKTASSGAQALKIARTETPDLILLDVMMPEMDGYEVLSELKKDDLTWKIPVIFITGLDSKEDEEKGLSMDAADYISKPFSTGIVMLRVKNQIQIVNQIRTIETLSLSDQLTGLPNRRNLDSYLDMEWKRAYRERQPLSLMMADIDKFKVFNDTYGHLIGDDVLKLVAGSFKSSLGRITDFAARFGGEEFAVVLPNTNLSGAREIGERVRRAVEQLVIPCGDGKTTKVTLSIGIYTCIPSAGDEIPVMIEKADRALYTAKDTGRNRVCVYGIDCNADEKPKADDYIPADIISKLSEVKGINTEVGMSHFNKMEKLYIETMEFFLTRLPVVTDEMDTALKNNDIKAFSITVHSVKSMLSTVGAMSASRLAAKLESAGKSGNAEFCREYYPQLNEKLSALQQQLTEIFSAPPADPEPEPEAEALDIAPPAPGERKKIIHVDDTRYTLVSLKRRLKEHFEIFSASSHAQMFKLLEKVLPDILLLDINMPGMDGYEIISTLKADERFKDIPVVFFTGINDGESVSKCMELGAADVIVKPITDAELIKRIYAV